MEDPQFNVDDVLKQAEKAMKEAESMGNGDEYDYQILYPYQNGSVRVKMLYNPASGLVMRKLVRHRLDDGENTIKNPCLQGMYSRECKTCKAVKRIEEETDASLWRNSATVRGIAFAQYIDSDYEDQENMPESGEIIILMFPFSVYRDINEIITDAGKDVEHLIYRNEGKPIKIKRKQGNNRVDYKATIDTFGEYKSFGSQEKFLEELKELPDLNNQIAPSEFNEEFEKVDRELATALEEKFLSSEYKPKAGKQKVEKMTSDSNSVTADVGNSTDDNEDRPECFGMHGSDEVDEDDCLVCPHEPECEDIS